MELMNRTVVATAMLLAGSAVADVITIRNTNSDGIMLSDLIVWDAAGNQEVILQPGFGDDESADDRSLGRRDSAVFVSNLVIKKTFVSFKFGPSEAEWKSADVNIVSGMAAMLADVTGAFTLHIDALDREGSQYVPPVGDQIFFVDGFNPDYPGWFVGTRADFRDGEILDGFNGMSEVVLSGIDVVVTPAPATIALAALAGIVGIGRRRR